MPKAETHVRVVRQWCQSLGVLTAVSISRHEAEMKLAAFVPLLMDRFPDAAFTTASLEHVAAQAVKGFPTYGELAAWLGDWWREHRPPLPRIEGPPPPPMRDPPTPDEIAYVEAVVRGLAGSLRSPFAEPRPPAPRHLAPDELDRINPLPGGRKRAQSSAATSASQAADDHARQAADDDAPAWGFGADDRA